MLDGQLHQLFLLLKLTLDYSYNATQCNAVQHNAIQYNTMQYSTMQYNAMQYFDDLCVVHFS